MTAAPDAVAAAARVIFAVEMRYIDRLRGLNPSKRTLDDLDRQEAEILARVGAGAPLIAKQALLDTADLLKPYSPVRAALAHQPGPTVDASWLRAHANTLTPKGN